jgi:ABC-type multidrug transport system fused ATPase/permease subunit
VIITEGIKSGKIEGNIEFRNIDFHYPTRPNVPILKQLNLSVRPGQTVAFVGYVSHSLSFSLFIYLTCYL